MVLGFLWVFRFPSPSREHASRWTGSSDFPRRACGIRVHFDLCDGLLPTQAVSPHPARCLWDWLQIHKKKKRFANKLLIVFSYELMLNVIPDCHVITGWAIYLKINNFLKLKHAFEVHSIELYFRLCALEETIKFKIMRWTLLLYTATENIVSCRI